MLLKCDHFGRIGFFFGSIENFRNIRVEMVLYVVDRPETSDRTADLKLMIDDGECVKRLIMNVILPKS